MTGKEAAASHKNKSGNNVPTAVFSPKAAQDETFSSVICFWTTPRRTRYYGAGKETLFLTFSRLFPPSLEKQNFFLPSEVLSNKKSGEKSLRF